MIASTVLLVLVFCTAAQSDGIWRHAQCPEQCLCSLKHSKKLEATLRTVDCSGRGLTEFPVLESLPSDVQVLLLNENRLRTLNQDIRLWFPDLLHLDLSSNVLSTIHYDLKFSASLFEGVYNLRVLDLSHNLLRSLPDNVFQGLFSLEELNLGSNRLVSISEDSFRGLLKLESLILSDNGLTFVQHSWWRNVRTLYNLFLDRNALSLVQADSFRPLRQLLSLDLSHNKLFRINPNAFTGLNFLDTLQLASNSLTSVPREALKAVRKTLKSINLSRNPIFKLSTDDFAQFPSLKDISLTSMQRLRLVERGAFKNLPEILVIQLHDNPYLAYLDSLTFVNTPELTHLLLHNNNLTVLERETLDSLPAMEELSFYGNPLSCDCNSRWLKERLADKESTIVFQESERMVCDSPAEHKFKLFSSLKPEDLPRRCAPKILYMFDRENARKVGDDISYDCRAVGVPKPHLTWITPEGKVLTPSTFHPRRILRNGETLVLKHIRPDDAGLYTCVAESEMGSTAAQTRLNVSNIQVSIFPLETTAESVRVGWAGRDASRNVFQILYREARPDTVTRHQYAGTATPVMTSFTIRNLQPNTDYEVCLAVEDSQGVVTHISCANFATKNMDFLIQDIERTSNIAVSIALGVVACMLIVVSLAAVGLKRSKSSNTKKTYATLATLESGTPACTPACTPVHKPKDPFTMPVSNCASVETLTERLGSSENVYSPLVPSSGIVVEKVAV